jgi:hypothetical protein
MMSDKELLELAAKAAGIVEDLRGGRDDDRLGLIVETKEKFSGDGYHFFPSRYWNPLTNDGDALRLAIKLDIDVAKVQIKFWDKHSINPYAATRRAIVRAAAEIGKEKK